MKPDDAMPDPVPKRRGRKLHKAAAAEDMRPRQAILEAALEAFSFHGFDGASLPGIAKAANVRHPLIHYYFGSKESLWKHMLEFAFGGLLSEVDTILAASRSLSPLDRLKVLVHTLALFAARHPNHLALLLVEARSRSDRATWLIENYTSKFVSKLRTVLVDAQAAKQIQDVPLPHLEAIIMGAVVLYFSANPVVPPGISREELASEHASKVLDVVLNGIRAPAL